MTITLNIDNPDTEEQLRQFVKGKQEITLDALRNFLNSFQKEEDFHYQKRDPRKYSRVIKREFNPDDVDEVALEHITDSAKFIHDLRREKR